MALLTDLRQQLDNVAVGLQPRPDEPLGPSLQPGADGDIGERGGDQLRKHLPPALAGTVHEPEIAPFTGSPVHVEGDGKQHHSLARKGCQAMSPGQVFVPVFLVEAMEEEQHPLGLPALGRMKNGVAEHLVLADLGIVPIEGIRRKVGLAGNDIGFTRDGPVHCAAVTGRSRQDPAAGGVERHLRDAQAVSEANGLPISLHRLPEKMIVIQIVHGVGNA